MMETEVIGPIERVKGIVEQAIESGKKYQSPQTGYVHYYFEKKGNEESQTIPIYENFLFALALLRSRLVDQIQMAKTLLTGLMAFQNRSSGNYPVYLHEYPICRDGLKGIIILAPLYWIIKHFGHVLGQELREQLEHSFRTLISFGKKAEEEMPFPYSLAVRFAATLVAGGRLFKEAGWEKEGMTSLKKLNTSPPAEAWSSTHHLADLLIAYQMADIDPFKDPLGQYLMDTWHPHLCCYVGPAVRELQRRLEPAPNLYDLYLGFFFGKFSRRTEELELYHLQGALIQPSEQIPFKTKAKQVTGQYKGENWLCIQEPEWACTLLDKGVSQNSFEGTFAPFRLLWGDSTFTHSLVSQGSKCSQVECHAKGNIFEIVFELSREIDQQDKEKQREINFYFDFSRDYQVLVDGSPATTFELGQTLLLQLGNKGLTIKFELVEGKGDFLGHLTIGNRPSQILSETERRYEAYDWNLFLRTIRRDSLSKVKATIRIDER